MSIIFGDFETATLVQDKAIIFGEFETATIVQDQASASGKSIVWPCSPTAKLVHDEGSATGKSIVWSSKASCASLGKAVQASVASTRANSPVDSGSDEDADCEVHGTCFDTFNADKQKVGVVGLRREIRNAILDDLGVELETCDSFSATSSSTTAGSPYLSSVGSSPYLSSVGSSPSPACAPPSPACAPPCALKVTGTCPPITPCTPPVKDASQRSPAGFLTGPRPSDASQRTPPQTQGALLQSSQRMLPQRVAQRIGSGLRRMGGGDASERSPVPMARGSWTASANCVAATRAAATITPAQPTAAGAYPDAASLAQVALAAADALPATHQVSTTNPSVAVSFVAADASPQVRPASVDVCFVAADASPQVRTASAEVCFVAGDVSPRARTANVEVCPADALKCWLKGSGSLPCGMDLPSGEDLEAVLRAAQPETYDD